MVQAFPGSSSNEILFIAILFRVSIVFAVKSNLNSYCVKTR